MSLVYGIVFDRDYSGFFLFFVVIDNLRCFGDLVFVDLFLIVGLYCGNIW